MPTDFRRKAKLPLELQYVSPISTVCRMERCSFTWANYRPYLTGFVAMVHVIHWVPRLPNYKPGGEEFVQTNIRGL